MVDFRIDVVVDPSGAVTGSRVVERELNQVQNRADGLRSSLGRVFALLGGGAIAGSRNGWSGLWLPPRWLAKRRPT